MGISEELRYQLAAAAERLRRLQAAGIDLLREEPEDNPKASLTDDEVREIRRSTAASVVLAGKFRRSTDTIRAIRRRESYRDVADEA
jgi:hypothetical protein